MDELIIIIFICAVFCGWVDVKVNHEKFCRDFHCNTQQEEK